MLPDVLGNQSDVEVKSAGTLGIQGLKPTKEALKMIENEGINTQGYNSKVLTRDLVDWADVILVMEPSHKIKVLELGNSSENKLYFLGEFNPEKGDIIIPDPIGRSLAFYRVTFGIIRQSIEEFLKCLKK